MFKLLTKPVWRALSITLSNKLPKVRPSSDCCAKNIAEEFLHTRKYFSSDVGLKSSNVPPKFLFQSCKTSTMFYWQDGNLEMCVVVSVSAEETGTCPAGNNPPNWLPAHCLTLCHRLFALIPMEPTSHNLSERNIASRHQDRHFVVAFCCVWLCE